MNRTIVFPPGVRPRHLEEPRYVSDDAMRYAREHACSFEEAELAVARGEPFVGAFAPHAAGRPPGSAAPEAP